MATKPTSALCPRFHFAVELIGRRWTGALLWVLAQGPARFSDLRSAVAGVTDPMLAERLRELEREGVIERRVLPGAPVGVEYALTAKGRALGSVLDAIASWSEAWLPAPRPGRATAARRRTARRKTAPRSR